MATMEIWVYREQAWGGVDLHDFSVEATDGGIGTVHEATNDVGSCYIVVDTGPWILGKKVMLPAGVINRIDADERKVYVDRTKDEIKDAPEFDEDLYTSNEYRSTIGSYYQRQQDTAYVDHV
jgi:hypothetical protein